MTIDPLVDMISLISFRVRHTLLAFLVDPVERVIRFTDLEPFYKHSTNDRSMASVGKSAPVITLNRMLGIKTSDITLDTRVIMIDTKTYALGVIADTVDYVISVDARMIKVAVENNDGIVIGSIVHKNNEILIVDPTRCMRLASAEDMFDAESHRGAVSGDHL